MLLFSSACDRGSSNSQTKEPAIEANRSTPGEENAQQDADFLVDAYSYGLMQTRYSRLAAEKAGTPAVKSFAEQSGTWHKDLNNEIAALASEKNIILPDSAGSDVQDYSKELEALPAADFELRYLEVLRQIQQNAISLYTNAAENAADSTVRSWATKKTTDLEAHAQAAQELTKQLKAQ